VEGVKGWCEDLEVVVVDGSFGDIGTASSFLTHA